MTKMRIVMSPDDDGGDHDVDDGDGKDNDCLHSCYYDRYKNDMRISGRKQNVNSINRRREGWFDLLEDSVQGCYSQNSSHTLHWGENQAHTGSHNMGINLKFKT